MKRTYFVCFFLCLTTLTLSQSNPVPLVKQTANVVPPISASQAHPNAQARILDSYGKLPLSFEANHGQTDSRVKFLSRTGEFTLFLTGDEAVLALSGKKESSNKTKTASAARTLRSGIAATKVGAVLRMKLRSANPAAKVTGVDELASRSNYFIGNDSSKWRTNVPTYAKVKYDKIYSGIDLVYYGNQRQLEYDFIVAPGADPSRITFDVSGANRIRRDANGELVFKVGEDEIRWHKPVVYQETNGTRQKIAAHYSVTATNRVAFDVGNYDTSKPLFIDPLIYSTYLGGSGPDGASGIAVDSAGNAYITGSTGSANFPVTTGAFQTTCDGGCEYEDAFVTKINPTGSALVYSTYLGGSTGVAGLGIAVSTAGNAYVTGVTYSSDFPVTPGAFQTTFGGGFHDAFVTALNPAGSALVFSSYLGGSGGDSGSGIAVDGGSNAYVIGSTCSSDFPTTPGAFQTTYISGTCPNLLGEAFVAKFNSTGSNLAYSTYLGGSTFTQGNGIAVDGSGNSYVTGYTNATDFPTMNPLQPSNGGYYDAYATKLNPKGSALIYSTYLGGSNNDLGAGIAVDSTGDAYVAGYTTSTNFPVTPGAFQTTCSNQNYCVSAAFVTKLTPAGSALVFSTYLGGGKIGGIGSAIAVDGSGEAYVTGGQASKGFPTTPQAFQKACKSGQHSFVSRFTPTGAALVYSTCLQGNGTEVGTAIAVDDGGNAYVAGVTDSTNFPTMNPFQPADGGSYDAFVTKIPMQAPTTITLSSFPNPSTYGESVIFTAAIASYLGTPPDGGTIAFKHGKTVLGTGMLSGGSASFTTKTLKAGTTTVKAVYGGDSSFAGSTSNAVKQVVEKALD